MPSVPTLTSILGTIGIAIVAIAVLVSILSALTARTERRQLEAAAPTHHRHAPAEDDGYLTADELAGLPAGAPIPAQRADTPAAGTPATAGNSRQHSVSTH